MARYIGPVCKLCRREGYKMFLKGERCITAKCAYERRAFAPGEHGRTGAARGGSDRQSDYARQLRAKQQPAVLTASSKLSSAAISVSQSSVGPHRPQPAADARTTSGQCRLPHGLRRQSGTGPPAVSHGHFTVNGRRTDIPSMLVQPDDVVEVREGSRRKPFFKELSDYAEKRACAAWLDRDLKQLSGKMLRLPERAEIDGNLNEQLIVEYYSR